MMSRVQKGVVAGLAATIAVSALEAVNQYLGWVVGFPRLLSVMLGMPNLAIAGWIANTIAGVLILGPIFGILCPRLPGSSAESKGIIFAVGAFLIMGMTVAPMAGVGVFGLAAGFGGLAWMLLVHAVYGVVLGNVYAKLVRREKRGHAVIGGATAH